MEVLFITFNYVDMLNQYLTNIFILKTNLYNLYFNIKGEGGTSFHQSIKQDINKVNSMYINLAELIKKIGGYPIMKLEEIKNISTIKEIPSKDYQVNEANNIVINNLNLINNMNKQVGEYAFKKNDLDSINLVLSFDKYLQQALWLLKMNK